MAVKKVTKAELIKKVGKIPKAELLKRFKKGKLEYLTVTQLKGILARKGGSGKKKSPAKKAVALKAAKRDARHMTKAAATKKAAKNPKLKPVKSTKHRNTWVVVPKPVAGGKRHGSTKSEKASRKTAAGMCPPKMQRGKVKLRLAGTAGNKCTYNAYKKK